MLLRYAFYNVNKTEIRVEVALRRLDYCAKKEILLNGSFLLILISTVLKEGCSFELTRDSVVLRKLIGFTELCC